MSTEKTIRLEDETTPTAPAKIDDPEVDELVKDFTSNRNILIRGMINRDMAFKVMLKLLHFDEEDSSSPIRIYIDSEGGEVSAGFTIIDTMRIIKAPVYTICFGFAASMAALILAAGEHGNRFATAHSTIMIHQPWSQMNSGVLKQSDLESYAESMKDIRTASEEILSETTGMSMKECHEATERDNFMRAKEALDCGIIDHIIVGKKKGIEDSTSGK